jgi:hypothetical protein
MKEKLLLSAVVLLGLMLILAHAQTPAHSESAIGRFQIIVAPGNQNEEVQAFKLDTITGKTWGKAYAMEGSAKTVAWAIIPDYPEPKQPK